MVSISTWISHLERGLISSAYPEVPGVGLRVFDCQFGLRRGSGRWISRGNPADLPLTQVFG